MPTKIGRAVQRPQVSADQPASDVSSPLFADKYPSLYRFLSELRETKNFHKAGSLSVFWEGGVFKVCLNDRPEFRSTFVSSAQLGEAFLIADRGLRSKTLRWRKNAHRSNVSG